MLKTLREETCCRNALTQSHLLQIPSTLISHILCHVGTIVLCLMQQHCSENVISIRSRKSSRQKGLRYYMLTQKRYILVQSANRMNTSKNCCILSTAICPESWRF